MGLKIHKVSFNEISKNNNLTVGTRMNIYKENKFSCNNGLFSYFVNCKDTFKVGSIKKELYQSKGRFKIVDQSQNYIAGFSDDEKLVYKGELPVIVFGDHTRIFKYIDFPFIKGADGIKIIIPNKDVIIPKFLYYMLNYYGVESRGYNRHYSILKKQKYPIISKSQQKKMLDKINPLELEIMKNRKQIKNINEIINNIFSEEFNYNKNLRPVP